MAPGVAAHIVQRGHNRAACFRRDSDYLLYLLHLRELSEKHGCQVHAYCLMTNHVHILLTPATADACTLLMRDLGQRYVQHFNRRYGRTGTLWEGRYRSFLAETARYVLACYRYIELNPVDAGMREHPGDYRWSSYSVNSGIRADPFISAHPEYAALGISEEQRQCSYRALFEQEMDEALRQAIEDATNSGYPLASDAFKASVITPLGGKVGPGKPGPRPKLDSGSEPDLRQTEFGL